MAAYKPTEEKLDMTFEDMFEMLKEVATDMIDQLEESEKSDHEDAKMITASLATNIIMIKTFMSRLNTRYNNKTFARKEFDIALAKLKSSKSPK